MNLNYILSRKHIFKKRNLIHVNRKFKLKIGGAALISLLNQRFELVYLRGFRKILRRKHIKKRMSFKRRKFWLFIRPNTVLTSKSVNSRMGAGVGSLVRLTTVLKSYKSFIEFKEYSPFWLKSLHLWTRFRYPLKYAVYH